MKPLSQLTNVEKGKLVHELFPDDIAGFIEFAEEFANLIINSKDSLLSKWENPFISLHQWLRITNDALGRIVKYRDTLPKRSRLFADQLFDGYTGFWTGDALIKYTGHTSCNNRRFKELVRGLFNAEETPSGDSSTQNQNASQKFWNEIANLLDLPFEVEEVSEITANSGAVWIHLRDGSSYFIRIDRSEDDTDQPKGK